MKSFVLDVRGEECPGPLVKTTRTLIKLNKGDELIVLTDMEECVRLIRETVEMLNTSSVHVERVEKYWKIIIRI